MSNNPAEPGNDLATAFTFIANREATLPSDLAEEFGHNMRYSREILGTLMQAKLVVLDTSTDLDFYTNVKMTGSPEQMFNKAFKVQADKKVKAKDDKPVKTPKAPASKDYHPCGCGCGENVPPKSAYRPGHDARHAGAVGRSVAADYPNVLGDAGLKGEIEKFISPDRPLLVAKATKVAHTAWAKAAAKKRHPSGASAPTEGIAKVGKNEVPARQFSDGSVEVMKDGEWAKASAAATKTFQEG